MKNRLVVGNLKMHLLTIRERDRYLQSMRENLRNTVIRDVDIVLCPPALHIEAFFSVLEKQPIFLGAQNIFWERKGAYTGEISPAMMSSFGVRFCLVGHSERRNLLGETDNMIAKKAAHACEENMEVMLCVGEHPEERDRGIAEDRVRKQLRKSLAIFPKGKISHLSIVYEPIWSIGTGTTPETHEIARMGEIIRVAVGDIFGSGAGSYIRVLYGGSVTSQNIRRVCLEADMDGVLVGGSSLKPDEFIRVIKNICED